MKKILLLFTLNAVYAAQDPNTSETSDENRNKITCWCVEEDDPATDIFDENGNFLRSAKKKSILPLYDRNILDVNIAAINFLFQENMNYSVIINQEYKFMHFANFCKQAYAEAPFSNLTPGSRRESSIQVSIIQSNEVIEQDQNYQKGQPLIQKDDALLANMEQGVERLKNEHEQDEKNEERNKKDNHAIEQVPAVKENFSSLINKEGFYFFLSHHQMPDDNTEARSVDYLFKVLRYRENSDQLLIEFTQQPLRRMDYGDCFLRFRDADTYLLFDIKQGCFTEDKIKGKLLGATQVKDIMKAEFDREAIKNTDGFDAQWALEYYEDYEEKKKFNGQPEQEMFSFKSKNYFVYNKLEEKGAHTTALGAVLPLLSLTYSNKTFE